MSAKNRARPLWPLPEDNAAKARPVLAAAPQLLPKPALAAPLGLAALSSDTQPRRFARVPTHAVGVLPEAEYVARSSITGGYSLPYLFLCGVSMKPDSEMPIAARRIVG